MNGAAQVFAQFSCLLKRHKGGHNQFAEMDRGANKVLAHIFLPREVEQRHLGRVPVEEVAF